MHWRRKWQPTPVLLPGESQGRGSLVGCHLWGHTESDTQLALVVKNMPVNAGDVKDWASTLGSGRSPGGGHGNLLQYPCLENPHEQRSLAG